MLILSLTGLFGDAPTSSHLLMGGPPLHHPPQGWCHLYPSADHTALLLGFKGLCSPPLHRLTLLPTLQVILLAKVHPDSPSVAHSHGIHQRFSTNSAPMEQLAMPGDIFGRHKEE